MLQYPTIFTVIRPITRAMGFLILASGFIGLASLGPGAARKALE